ncbi:MAG TPA: DUF488 domain-containing protein [Ferruginibacter sp.]|nr:DUF488 domain-containing protein [Ferruginibacter sp.]
MNVKIKRIYEPFEKSDGYRILIDRLWPRGIKKEAAHIDQWMKEIAPSTNLRKWFNHEPEKWKEFNKKYITEIKGAAAFEAMLSQISEHKKVTLLFAAKDELYNHAVILQQLITEKI